MDEHVPMEGHAGLQTLPIHVPGPFNTEFGTD